MTLTFSDTSSILNLSQNVRRNWMITCIEQYNELNDQFRTTRIVRRVTWLLLKNLIACKLFRLKQNLTLQCFVNDYLHDCVWLVEYAEWADISHSFWMNAFWLIMVIWESGICSKQYLKIFEDLYISSKLQRNYDDLIDRLPNHKKESDVKWNI